MDFNELATFFEQAGIGKQLVPVVLRVFDKEQVGSLTFQQFWAYSQEAEKGQGDPRYLYWLLFQAIDANKSGYLELPEVIEFGTYLGYQLTDQQAIEIMKSVDAEQRGAVKFEEVCTAFYL